MSSSANDGVGQVSAASEVVGENFDQSAAPNGAPPGDIGNNVAATVNPLRYEFNRLKTFPLQWGGHYNKLDLAKNGFYYAGEGVRCKCAFCDQELEAVNTGNFLEDHHKIISVDCDFAHYRPTDNIPMGDTTNYRIEKHRLVSFLRTSWWAPVDPYNLAKWGFYWTGTADVGRCTFCRLEVRGWEQGDRGESEHQRWNPQCAFMEGRAVGNIPLGEETPEQLTADRVAVQRNDSFVTFTGPRHMTAEELGVTMTTPPKHQQYSTLNSRLGSFAVWPLSLKQRPPELSEAGFYYTGKGDRVVCFQCGGGLKDWGQTDIPWVEHAVWFYRCSYLLLKKGREFVDHVQALKEAQMGNQDLHNLIQSTISSHLPAVATNQASNLSGQASLAASSTSAVTADTAPFNPELIEESQEHQNIENNAPGTGRAAPQIAGSGNEEVRDLRMCKVCFQKELGIVFLPCGHMATCPDCAPQLSNCPICRATTNAYVRAFLP